MIEIILGYMILTTFSASAAGGFLYFVYKLVTPIDEGEMIEYSLGVRVPKGSKRYSTHQMGPRGGIYEWRTSRNGTQYKKY